MRSVTTQFRSGSGMHRTRAHWETQMRSAVFSIREAKYPGQRGPCALSARPTPAGSNGMVRANMLRTIVRCFAIGAGVGAGVQNGAVSINEERKRLDDGYAGPGCRPCCFGGDRHVYRRRRRSCCLSFPLARLLRSCCSSTRNSACSLAG